MRKLLIGFAISIGAVLAGLLLASLFLKQECPDCSATTLLLRENPSQCFNGPAILDCPRCGDSGRVSLLNGKVGPAPDPFIAQLMRHSNRSTGRDLIHPVATRLQQSPLKIASGINWGSGGAMIFRSRFILSDGKRYVLLMHPASEFSHGDNGMQIHLFDLQGSHLDAVYLKAWGGVSSPEANFIIPVEKDGPCVKVSLLNWLNRPCKSVEIDHAGKLWKEDLSEPLEKLEQLEWKVHLRHGKLQIVDAAGKTIAE